MPETPAPVATVTLADLCSDLLAFAVQLKKSADPGEAEALRQKIDEQFRALEVRARQADIPQEDLQQAKYAIVAFLDEIVLTSSWPLKEAWADKPLQLLYFNEFAAGEEFYNRIDQYRGARKNSVLEVYYLSLSLGFRGKYVDLQGMEKKKVLMDTLVREIRGAAGEGAGKLAPHWQPPDTMTGMVRNFPAWVIAAGCGILVALVFVLLSAMLGWSADGILNGLR
ncbi:MAG TPA: type IVB secretion system protein IcmH/DotU [Planctomycetota bacterium]|nr:type IVB secretion system protein IcmH/DotU [Planctomycetota bacterium]